MLSFLFICIGDDMFEELNMLSVSRLRPLLSKSNRVELLSDIPNVLTLDTFDALVIYASSLRD